MKIAILGTGNVGAVLGRRLAALGHSIVFGVRDPIKDGVRELVDSIGDGAVAARVEHAASGADVVFLATPWEAAQDVITKIQPDLDDVVLVDCTNPVKPDLSGLSVGHDDSAGECVARWAPHARVVKAFNTTGAGNMADPTCQDQPLTMFLCGDDDGAKSLVGDLTRQLGFDVCDAGGLDASRYLEPLAMLWIRLAYAQQWGPEFGFRVLRR